MESEPGVLQLVENDRRRILDVFENAVLRPAYPQDVALSTMQEALQSQRPQLSSEENHILESGLRALLVYFVGKAVAANEYVMQFGNSSAAADGRGPIMRLLDISLYLCEHGHTEAGMVFTLLEDLTEVSTIADCKQVFEYIESKQEVLGKAELLGRGKLVLLRACNQLLRRLSKANDVVFCGRILMFLAHFFPISERSAANIKGNFNTSNKTNYLKEPPEGLDLDEFKFYKTFWGLQEYFCHPLSLLQPAKWQAFSADLTTALERLEAQPLGEDESSSVTGADAAYNTKYLTSPNLLHFELRDRSFRRYILVQSLFVLDYLKAPGKAEKDEKKEALREEVKVLEERVKRQLASTPPRAKEFVRRVDHILEREHNWAAWKKDGCPAFDRAPAGGAFTESGQKRKARFRMGNRELDRLFKMADKAPSLTDPKRVKIPRVADYFSAMAEDMDPEAKIEAEYHHKNNAVYCWRGLRLACRQDKDGFGRYGDLGIEGVVPPNLLTEEVRQKLYPPAKEKGTGGSRAKPARKEATPKVAAASNHKEPNQSNGTVPSGFSEVAPAGREEGEASPMETDAVGKIQTGQSQSTAAAPAGEAQKGHEGSPPATAGRGQEGASAKLDPEVPSKSIAQPGKSGPVGGLGFDLNEPVVSETEAGSLADQAPP